MRFHPPTIAVAAASLFAAALLATSGAATTRPAQSKDSSAAEPQRVQDGLVTLYDFSTLEDSFVSDRAGSDQPLHLRTAKTDAVRHSDAGLELVAKTLIQSERPAKRLVHAVRQSGAVTLEAWIRPARTDQSGPARIVTLSRNPNERNFTLGQDGDKFEVRMRTSSTSTNGIPAVSSKPQSLRADWMHVVYTRNRSGTCRIFIDGKLNVEQAVAGDLSNWDDSLHVALGNELSGDRPWLGAYRLVAIYDRDLAANEVAQNFRAGAKRSGTTPLAQDGTKLKFFETRIAPLLSRHCLECHDTLARKGKLDLSRKAAAFEGGAGGPAIVAGKPAESPLWQLVESDEMPFERPPLSAEEKRLLRQWLDDGAAWSLDTIDPAVYAHGGDSRKIFVQRLTVPEYVETVRGTLGVDIAQEARERLPRDLRADGFSNTAYNLNVDLEHVEAYAALAELVAARVDVKALAAKYTKSRELSDENITKVIEPVGHRLLRGPLNKAELAVYCGVSTTVAASGGQFETAIRYILEAMLQSPRFLYRIERQHGDGSPRPLDHHELAARLSYILWGAPPDDPLRAAAEKGALDRPAVEAHARRMLQDRRAVERSRRFLMEWLNLDHLDHLRPDPKKFPHWDIALAADMREETLRFFEELVWKQNRPLADLMNAPLTFLTPRLAKHYGLAWNRPEAGDEFARYDLTAVPGRSGGLLTHGSVLTVGGDEASMVTRGLFVMHELLRGVVRDPPPCVDTTPVPTKPGLSQRAVSDARIADKNCTGCHAKFEPLAFALEKFDGLGSFHEKDEHGNRLREDGSVTFPGAGSPVQYQTTAELLTLLAQSDRVRETITWKITQFALGRPLTAADAAAVADIHRSAQNNGGTYASLMTAIVTSDLVMMSRTEPSENEP